MKLLFFIAILISVVLIFYHFKKSQSVNEEGSKTADAKQAGSLKQPAGKRVFDGKPDMPSGFGYKSQWFAIKTENTDEVAKELNLTSIQAANWSTGLEGADEGYYFVAPPVNGWILVVHSLMPDITDSTNENPLKTIEHLSRKYGEACYFGTHRTVDYHAWAKAVNGEIARAYGYLGESGETLINEGGLTAEELAHDLDFTNLDDGELHFPDEEHVLLLAKEWSIDPLMEYDGLNPGVGLVGRKLTGK